MTRKIGGKHPDHHVELLELAVEEGVGGLLFAVVGAGAAVGFEQDLERRP